MNARKGPRQLKDPRSREYAVQTMDALKRHLRARVLDAEAIRRELALIKTHQHWHVLGHATLNAYLHAETGYTETGLTQRLVDLDALDRAQQEQPPARDERGRFTVGDNITPGPNGTSRQKALRVLRNKRPDLHASALAGVISPHAAMIEAGFRRPTLTVPADPARALAKLIARFGLDTMRPLMLKHLDQE